MKQVYIYNEQTYDNAYSVRQALYKAEKISFGPEPEENKTEFWAALGVQYSEEEDPQPTIEEVKASKLAELDRAFIQWYEQDAVVTSSLGFVADSDSRAITDVTGLVTVLEAQPAETRSTVAFMDHANVPHTLTLDQIKTVQLEIIQNGQSAYAQKWAYRTAIESAESLEALQAMTFDFTGEDFSSAAS